MEVTHTQKNKCNSWCQLFFVIPQVNLWFIPQYALQMFTFHLVCPTHRMVKYIDLFTNNSLLLVVVDKTANIQRVQIFQPQVLRNLIAPWYASNYTTPLSLKSSKPNSVNSTAPSVPSPILLLNPFPLSITLLTHQVDYTTSGPGFFSCEWCGSDVTFQRQKVPNEWLLSHAATCKFV